MNQPPLFDVDEVSGAAIAPEPEPERYALHGENREGIGQLQDDVVAWTFEGGVWWMTGEDGSITGYNFEHYFWLSLRKQVL